MNTLCWKPMKLIDTKAISTFTWKIIKDMSFWHQNRGRLAHWSSSFYYKRLTWSISNKTTLELRDEQTKFYANVKGNKSKRRRRMTSDIKRCLPWRSSTIVLKLRKEEFQWKKRTLASHNVATFPSGKWCCVSDLFNSDWTFYFREFFVFVFTLYKSLKDLIHSS